MSRALNFVCTLCVVLLVASGIATLPGCVENQKDSDPRRVVDHINQISIIPPVGWERGEDTSEARLVHVGQVERSGLQASLNVVVTGRARPDLKKGLEELAQGLPRLFTDWTLIASQELEIDGRPTLRIAAQFRSGQLNLRNAQYIVIDKGKTVTITYTTEEDSFEGLASTFDQSAKTLQFE